MGRIVYKVTTESRRSITMSRDSLSVDKYCKTYEKDTIVKATYGSLGIFVFGTYEDAYDFKECYPLNTHKILKCEAVGRKLLAPSRIPVIHTGYTNEKVRRATKVYMNDLDYISTQRIPSGTLCYRAIKVLE